MAVNLEHHGLPSFAQDRHRSLFSTIVAAIKSSIFAATHSAHSRFLLNVIYDTNVERRCPIARPGRLQWGTAAMRKTSKLDLRRGFRNNLAEMRLFD
jgi:hypothetical protein